MSRRALGARVLATSALAVLVGALLALGACASGKARQGSVDGGTVTLLSASKGATLRIVSDAWVASQGYAGETIADRRTDYYRKNTYSASGASVAVKVCEDEIFAGIVEALEGAGFAQHAASGAAPTTVGGQTIELTQGREARHFGITPATPVDTLKDFATCRKVVGEVFNALDGYQSGDGNFRFKE